MKHTNKLIAVGILGAGYLAYQRNNSNNMANARKLLKKWINAVNSGNKQSVLNLYSQDAVLLPTIPSVTTVGYEIAGGQISGLGTNSYIANGKEKIKLYMTTFLELPQLRGTYYENTFIFKKIGMNAFSIDGVYKFDYLDTDQAEGETDILGRTQYARFTFIYKRDQFSNNWLITNQNSNKGGLYINTELKK